jgi:hypothetical protein
MCAELDPAALAVADDDIDRRFRELGAHQDDSYLSFSDGIGHGAHQLKRLAKALGAVSAGVARDGRGELRHRRLRLLPTDEVIADGDQFVDRQD